MNATAEIDKAGRLVVPKKMRDALHLVPGTRLSLKQEGDHLLIEAERPGRGLYIKRGMLVYDAGTVPPSDAVEWVEKARQDRMDSILRDVSGR